MTFTYSVVYILALANWGLCSLIGWACICRWARMSARTTRKDVRAYYMVLFGGALASGWAPVFWQEYPGPGAVGLAFGTLLVLVGGSRDWKNGLPAYARSAPAPFDALG